MSKRQPLDMTNDRAFSTLETLHREAKFVRDRIAAIREAIEKVEKEAEPLKGKNYMGQIGLTSSFGNFHGIPVFIPSDRLAELAVVEMKRLIGELQAVLKRMTTDQIRGY